MGRSGDSSRQGRAGQYNLRQGRSGQYKTGLNRTGKGMGMGMGGERSTNGIDAILQLTRSGPEQDRTGQDRALRGRYSFVKHSTVQQSRVEK